MTSNDHSPSQQEEEPILRHTSASGTLPALTETPAPSGLAALLARVEAATAPDREIDCILACRLGGYFPALKDWPVGVHGNQMTWRVDFCCYRDGGPVSPGHGGDQMIPGYTASLDAALALLMRCFPACDWCLSYLPGPNPTHEAWVGQTDTFLAEKGANNSGPIALIAALLKALIANGQDGPADRPALPRETQSIQPPGGLK